MRASRAAVVASLCAAVGLASHAAHGQRVQARRAKTLLVGTPPGASPTDRVDTARSGATSTLLPTGTLHVAWRRNLGLPVEGAPLVGPDGDVTVLTARGDVVVLAANGEERTDTVVGSAAASPATLLSDATAAFLTAAGDVVGVRLGRLRFRTHVGGGRSSAGPLSLSDGGVVFATSSELVALDAEGAIRARAALGGEDPVTHALVGAADPRGAVVYALTEGGAVFAWTPAAGADVSRVGAFGGSTDGGMALVPAGATSGPLLAAVVGAELVTLDPRAGTLATRALATASGALGFLGPPVVRRDGAIALLALTASRTVALAVDADGAEILHQAIGPTLLASLPDGGVGLGAILPHVGPLLDAQNALAFALASGELGTVSAAGAVDVVGDVCSRPTGSGGAGIGTHAGAVYAGLAPAAPFAIVAACSSGVVARFDSDFAHVP
jgi:hypothetical protein